VQAAHDDLVVVAVFDPELKLGAFHSDDPGEAMNCVTLQIPKLCRRVI
jgi:hypothetical protein